MSLSSFQCTAIRRLFQQAMTRSKKEESKYGPEAISRWKDLDTPTFLFAILVGRELMDEDEVREHYNEILKIYLTTLKQHFGKGFLDS